MRDELDKAKAEMINKDVAIANLQNQLIGVVSELEAVTLELKERDVAIASLESELAAGNKQLTLFLGQDTTPIPTQISSPEPEPEPEPTPTPTQTPELKTKTKSKANPKAKSNPAPEIDLASLIIPPGYKLGDSAELIEFVLEKFPNSELKNKGDITDAIRDRHGKAKGSENSRLFNFEQECGFKHLGKAGAKHKFLIPIA